MTIVLDNPQGEIWIDDVEYALGGFPNRQFPVDIVDGVYGYGDQIHVDIKGFVRAETVYEIEEMLIDEFHVNTYILD